jgi:hypothetical protein
MIRLVVPTALMLLTLAAAGPVTAAPTPDPFMGDPFNRNQVLGYRWGAGAAPPSAIKDAIRAAVDDANSTRHSKAPTFEYQKGAGNTISYGVDAPCGVNGLACFRRDAPDWFSVHLRENGHRYDWGTLRWCEASGRPKGCYDAENITLDELGHVYGLDHHVNLPDDTDYGDAVVQTYSRVKPQPYYNAHSLGRCDVATLQRVYDVETTTTLYSTCLDVPTVLDLAASSTWVLNGATVNFTATLTSDGPGRLSDNRISDRSVVLQERTSSGWSDVATMQPGSSNGTYVASVVVRSSDDWRARFRSPTNEGLRASSSGVISISVSTACVGGGCVLVRPGPG